MFNLANLFQEHEFKSTSKELMLLQDFINDKTKLGPTAKSLTRGIKIKYHYRLYRIAEVIIFVAINSFDSAVEQKCVELVLEIRDLRRRLLNPKYTTSPCEVFGEMLEIIGDKWEGKYLVPSFNLLSNIGR